MPPGSVTSRREFLSGAAALLAAGAGCSRDLSLPPEPAPLESNAVSVVEFGAHGDGVTDDTAAIQRALNQARVTGGTVLVPPGTYMIDVAVGLMLRGATTLQLAPGATLKALPTATPGQLALVRCGGRGNTIEGGHFMVEGRAPWLRACQLSFGILVRAAADLLIRDVAIDDAFTDNIYVGLGVAGPNENVTIERCVLRGGRRQGISVTHGTGIHIRDCIIEATGGASPSAGIDLEPNPGTAVNDVEISRCRLASNAGYGLLAVGLFGPVSNVRVADNETVDNGEGGVRLLKTNRVRIAGNRLGESSGPAISVDVGSRDVVIEANHRSGNGAIITDAPTPIVGEQRQGGGGCRAG